ncbi:MAG: hypothetical protein HQL99_16330 [Magnetococcales bacterium]|nr:hypothetical protein [Magnetococcales bacterium]
MRQDMNDGFFGAIQLYKSDIMIRLKKISLAFKENNPRQVAIESQKETQRKPLFIVVLSAHSMEGEAKLCLDGGCDAYLSKPIGKHRLLAALERYGNTLNDCWAQSTGSDEVCRQGEEARMDDSPAALPIPPGYSETPERPKGFQG